MSSFEDLLDSNFIFSSEKINVFAWRVYQKRYYYYLAFGLARYLWHVLGSFKTIIYLPTLFKIKKDNIVVIITSSNQYDSILSFLKDESFNIKAIAIDWKGGEGVLKFPMFISYLVSIFYIPKTLYYYFTCKDAYVKNSFKYGFREYCLTFAFRFVNRVWLKLCKPRLLVILTDHQMVARDMAKSAKRSGVRTLYMQHASVTDKFPALITDYAFLEGNDAKDKYLNISHGHSDTTIELVGILKLNGITSNTDKRDRIANIGICTNEFDDIEIADKLIKLLKKEYKITLRPHPGDHRYELWHEMAQNHDIIFSGSRSQSASDFLMASDCVVSYNCGIITEALMLNKPTFSFQLSKEDFDHYGFIEHDIVSHFNNAADLAAELKKIRNNPDSVNWKGRVKYYCDTIDTPYEGKSSELVKQLFIKYGI
jgi:hypothetical protein